jgi:hypothetical protein
VKAPDFGDRRKLLLEDMAIMTGGQVFSPEKGMKLDKFSWDWFGKARLVTITKDQTTIVDGKGDQEKIDARIEELQAQIDKSVVPYEKEKLQERLAKFIGGVATGPDLYFMDIVKEERDSHSGVYSYWYPRIFPGTFYISNTGFYLFENKQVNCKKLKYKN